MEEDIVKMQIIQKEGATEPGRIRVLSYNIRHGEGMDGKIDLNRIASTINSVSPDIVSLQEVDDRRERTGGVDQVERYLVLRSSEKTVAMAMLYCHASPC